MKRHDMIVPFHAISLVSSSSCLVLLGTTCGVLLFFRQLNVYHLGASLMGIDRAERWLTARQLLQHAERSQADSNLQPSRKTLRRGGEWFLELLFFFLDWEMNFVRRNKEILLMSFLISISFQLICAISVCELFTEEMLTFVALPIGTEQYKAPAVCSECCQGLVAHGTWPTARDARSESCRPAQQVTTPDPPCVVCFQTVW